MKDIDIMELVPGQRLSWVDPPLFVEFDFTIPIYFLDTNDTETLKVKIGNEVYRYYSYRFIPHNETWELLNAF